LYNIPGRVNDMSYPLFNKVISMKCKQDVKALID
jgi:hypothetical protein